MNDSQLTMAAAAARRWNERSGIRVNNIAHPIESETPERLKKRMDRLERAVHDQARASQVTSDISMRMVETIGLERVLGNADFLGINFLELALAVSRFVGRVVIRGSGGRIIGYGTGFMVSPRLLITNNHVLNDITAAQRSEVEFDYQYDRYGRLLPTATFPFDVEAFFTTSERLDYTLVAVKPQSIDGRAIRSFGWSKLIGEEGKAMLGDSLNIIQHPKGEPKQIVLRANKLVDILDDFLHYQTDTHPGSSGSGVYNDQWEVVALHHSGVPEIVNNRYKKSDGSYWNNNEDPELINWIANEGIRVSKIVQHITGLQMNSRDAESLRDELLHKEPPHPFEVLEQDQSKTQHASVSVPSLLSTHNPISNTSSNVMNRTDDVMLTVPLTITVSLGTTPNDTTLPNTLRPIMSPTHIQPKGWNNLSASANGSNSSTCSCSSPSSTTDSGYQEAIDLFEHSRTREYYDEANDKKVQREYYGDLESRIQSLDSTSAYRELHDLTSRAHTTQPSYNPRKWVYPWVDTRRDSNGISLQSVYSGNHFDPLEIIREDFEIEQRRNQMMESLLNAIKNEHESIILFEQLEASLPYNCEHVVPQSWFGKKEPMRGDLHHLFTCESGCNSFRGNIPYYDFPDFEEVIRQECGKREENKFEPGFGKGAVARATFYFLVRYPSLINNSHSEYSPDRIKILLRWHSEFPPDEYERHRNAAIYEIQGNRNPFIDFPNWASIVNLQEGLG